MKLIPITLLLAILATSCGFNKTTQSKTNNKLTNSNLLDQNFEADYSIINTDFGTETNVIIKGGKRVMTTNSLPNHSTGTFPNKGNPNSISAQNKEYSFPTNPTLSGESKWARQPGVALNGVKFEPETAERFVCETGEEYRIEAFQDLVDLGLDKNLAHVQPTGEYHYHGVPKGLVQSLDNGSDIVLVGYAMDGFPIYYSKSGKYKPSYVLNTELRTGDVCSYKNPHTSMDKELNNTNPDGTFVSDWKFQSDQGDLDECNGIEMDGKYCYFVTDNYPYVGRCLKGEFKESRPSGPPPGSHSHGKGGRPHTH